MSKWVWRGSLMPNLLGWLTLLVAGAACHNSYAGQPTGVPDQPGQVMLIRNTLTAVNHGTLTGNFTVLRDLASERFRQQNTAGDLAATFGNLRKLDLSPVLVAEPVLTKPPAVDEFRGRLQLVGHVPTRPKAVRFLLIFQRVNGGWLIDEISLVIEPTESVACVQPALQPLPGVAR